MERTEEVSWLVGGGHVVTGLLVLEGEQQGVAEQGGRGRRVGQRRPSPLTMGWSSGMASPLGRSILATAFHKMPRCGDNSEN